MFVVNLATGFDGIDGLAIRRIVLIEVDIAVSFSGLFLWKTMTSPQKCRIINTHSQVFSSV